MTDGEEFSFASAKRAADGDRLADWVVDFLVSPGSDNAPLAAALVFGGATYLGPVRLRLDQITPLAGPDPDEVVVPVGEEEWEADVDAMKSSIQQGWHPPPLLVSHRDGRYFLEDGNHRYETLRRAGVTHAWVILVFTDQTQRRRFLAGHGLPDDRANGTGRRTLGERVDP